MQFIDGLVQERRNSSALATELRLSCTNPSIWTAAIKTSSRDEWYGGWGFILVVNRDFHHHMQKFVMSLSSTADPVLSVATIRTSNTDTHSLKRGINTHICFVFHETTIILLPQCQTTYNTSAKHITTLHLTVQVTLVAITRITIMVNYP